MSDFKGIVKLSKKQYESLRENGTLTVGDTTINYDPYTTLYVTPHSGDVGEGGGSVNVVDSLISQSATDALSARQGNVLYNMIAESVSDVLSLDSDQMDNYLAEGGLTQGQLAICKKVITSGYDEGATYRFDITYPNTYSWTKISVSKSDIESAILDSWNAEY